MKNWEEIYGEVFEKMKDMMFDGLEEWYEEICGDEEDEEIYRKIRGEYKVLRDIYWEGYEEEVEGIIERYNREENVERMRIEWNRWVMEFVGERFYDCWKVEG